MTTNQKNEPNTKSQPQKKKKISKWDIKIRKIKLFFDNYPIWQYLLFLIVVILIYIAIYFSFTGKGFIPPGEDLEKRDWLSFFGDFLSFVGTVAVSIAALWQTTHYNKRADKQRAEDRWKSIQPVFSVVISKRNGLIPNAKIYSTTKHNNVAIQIKNVVDNPAINVSIFNAYRSTLLTKEDNPITCYCAYENSPDAKLGGEVTVLNEKSYPKDANGLPGLIQILYEDMDGNSLAQSFEPKSIDGKMCYSYSGIIKLPKEKFEIEF